MTMNKELRTIIATVISATLIGMGSAYLTAITTLARFETEQRNLYERVERLEADQKNTSKDVAASLTELRVLNERLKRIDDMSESIRRVERKVDSWK